MRFQKLTADQLAALNAGQSIEIVLPHHAHEVGETFWLDGHELKVMSVGNTKDKDSIIIRQRLTLESLSVLPDDSEDRAAIALAEKHEDSQPPQATKSELLDSLKSLIKMRGHRDPISDKLLPSDLQPDPEIGEAMRLVVSAGGAV